MVDFKASETTVASERRESKAQQEVLRLDSCFCCFLQVYTDRTSVYTVYVALMGTRHTHPHQRTPTLPIPAHTGCSHEAAIHSVVRIPVGLS